MGSCTTISTSLAAQLGLSAALLLGSHVCGADQGQGTASTETVSRPIDDLDLALQNGGSRKFAELKGALATAIIFVFPECPVCKRLRPEIASLQRLYASSGIKVLMVDVTQKSREVQRQSLRKFLADTEIDAGLVAIDEEAALAAALSATTVPEAVVVDSRLQVVYQGAVDATIKVGGSFDKNGTRYLAKALEEISAGRPVALSRSSAFGCRINRD